jgi:hypothetical protein
MSLFSHIKEPQSTTAQGWYGVSSEQLHHSILILSALFSFYHLGYLTVQNGCLRSSHNTHVLGFRKEDKRKDKGLIP